LKVFVNGVKAAFSRKDPLKSLIPAKQKIYSGSDFDSLYRAGLELSRDGELLITVPDLSSSKTEPPKPIPKRSPKDVIERYDKLLKAYNSLIAENVYEINDEPQLPQEKTAQLLQITIKYHLQSSHGSSSTNVDLLSGLTFRRQPSFARKFEKNLASVNSTLEHLFDMKYPKEPAQCCYSTSFTNGSLRDIDSVRCWLPCIDTLDQRLVFDISIYSLKTYHVISSGKRILIAKHESQSKKPGKPSQKNIHRFFTANRIPVSQLGFFIGKVESYRMPLHKTKGKIYVATGLADYLGAGALPVPVSQKHPITTTASTEESAANVGADASASLLPVEKSLLKRPRSTSVDPSPNKDKDSSSHPPPPPPPPPPSSHKKPKHDRSTSPPPFHMPVDKTLMRSLSPTNSGKYGSHQSHAVNPSVAVPPPLPTSSSGGGKEFSISVRRLYSDLVYHSVLGFDLAIRVIQKFVNHRYEYDEYGMVFIHELGRDFMAFDSFVFIDAKYLHLDDQIYLETTTNLILVKAFLYSWLKSDIPISSYENEFILHGVIGYLVCFYLEEVYGEDEGRYYLQKMMDIVISLEQQGKGYPLSSSFYPEKYEVFSMAFGQYLLAKSMVLFQLIENKIGGRDSMRIALKQMIKAPTMFAATLIKSTSPSMNSYTYDFTEKSPKSSSPQTASPHFFSGLSPEVQTPYSDGGSMVETPIIGQESNLGFLSPYQGALGYAGYPTAATGQQQQQQAGSFTPYAGFSPYRSSGTTVGVPGGGYAAALGALTPFANAGMHSGERDVFDSSPLSRQMSMSSEDGWEKSGGNDPYRFEMHTLTAESFILLLRHVSEASTDLDETFLERYVYNAGIMQLRIHVKISERVEGKTRTIFMYTDQVGVKHSSDSSTSAGTSTGPATSPSCFHQIGDFGKNFIKKENLNIILVEERDNNITRSTIPFGAERYEYKQQAYARPGRRSGRTNTAPSVKALEEMSSEERDKYYKLEQEKENRKSALQLVRDSEYGIRYILVDPSLTFLMDIQNHSADILLVEQLNANFDELGPDMDRHKVYYQCQAIRSLSRATFQGLLLPNASATGTTTATSSSADNSAIPNSSTFAATSSKGIEKQAKVQIKALSDCILGITTTGTDNRPSSTASIFVRAEAAFALAKWQNEYSPETVNSEPAENNNWPAMQALMECLFELFMDPTSKAPIPIDFQNESSIYLRNALLLALSSMRSQTGQTPWEIVQTLLIFVEDLDHLEASQQQQGGGNQQSEETDEEDQSEEKPPTSNKPSKAYDITYYRAILLCCLSRIRFETIDCTNESTHPVIAILEFANSVITNAYTRARAISRIQYKSHDANYLPKLVYEGLDVSAALTCLVEMDIQTAYLLSVGKGKGPTCSKLLDLIAPTQQSILTKTYFQSYFLPPGVSLMCLYDTSSKEHSNINLKTQFHYYLCSPLIRITAFECFVRLSFALHVAHYQKLSHEKQLKQLSSSSQAHLGGGGGGGIPMKKLSSTGSTTSTSEENTTSFVAVAVEAYQNIMEKDPSIYVRQQATQILLDAIMDKPARMCFEGLSLSCEWFTYGWSDCLGLTLNNQEYSSFDVKRKMNSFLEMKNSQRVPPISQQSLTLLNPQKYSFHMEGTPLRAAISCLVKMITKTTAFNQLARSQLLSLWLYTFEEKIPPVLANNANISVVTPLTKMIEDIFPLSLDKERLIIRNSKELSLLFHEVSFYFIVSVIFF
jgi:hypothetical protein